jgi:hypothetical protein
MRRALAVTVLLCAGCASQTKAVKAEAETKPAEAPKVRAFTAEVVEEGSGAPEGFHRQVTVVGEKVRMDFEGNGRQSTQIFRGNGQAVLVLEPAKKIFHEMKASPLLEAAAKAMDVEDLAHPCGLSAEGAACTRVGVEQFEGRTVTRWKTVGTDGLQTSYLVDESLRYLLRVERPNGARGLKNVQLIAPDETLFAAPADYTAAAPHN